MQEPGTIAESGARLLTVPVPVPVLGRWGLSPHADLVYRSLVLFGPSTRRQLVGQLGVTATKVSQALDELSGVGAVNIEYRDLDRRWIAVDPTVVVSRLRRSRQPVVLSNHRQHLAAVAGLHLERVPVTAVRRLPSRIFVRERIAELAAAERYEHLAINTEEVIRADAASAANPLDRALVARGVRLRTLGLIPREGDSDGTLLAGIEHRQVESLPLKVMVFDRRCALFPADPADFDAGAVEIDDLDSVAHLTQFFYRIWHTASDPRGREVPPVVLTTREQRIVALLAIGFSEEAVAAEIGISRRTVAYALRALMDRLGVDNRFQLALVLGAAQAVPLPPVSRSPRKDL